MEIVRIENATKQFKETVAVGNVSIILEEGLIYGIVGKNGSGKSILLKIICGLLPLTSGRIIVDGKQIGRETDVPEDIGIIIESPGFLPNYNAFHNLKFLASLKKKINITQIRETIQLVGLDPDNKKHVGKYSMGMRQRLGIAQAIMENPKLLVLDEPFNGLDFAGVSQMRKLFLELKQQGKTIIIASHCKEDIDGLCDTVFVMDNGRIIDKIAQDKTNFSGGECFE